jgi:hypothetical protein
MFLRHLNLNPFFEESASTGNLSGLDALDFLNSEELVNDEIELEENKETNDKDPKEEEKETTLEDELEDELKNEQIDEDEVLLPVGRKEVLAKYPNIFKEFPHLDKAVYREQKYAEILPTIKDAQLAVEKAQTLDTFSTELADGKTSTIMRAVKDEDPEAFNSLVDNLLPELKAVDEGAYYHTIGNIIKMTVAAMHSSDDADTKTAAALLYKFIFNSDKYTPPSNLSTREVVKDDRERQIEEKEQKFRETQLNTNVEDVNNRVSNSIESTIDKYIDPRQSMNDWQRERAVESCKNELIKQIENDKRFQSLLDKLWEKSAEDNFSQASKDRIKQAYLSKAKGLLPEIIKNTRNKALRGLGRKSPESDKRGPLPVGKPANERKTDNQQTSRSGMTDRDKAKALPKGTKSLDYLMKD